MAVTPDAETKARGERLEEAIGVLKRFNAAFKASRMYSPEHGLTQECLSVLEGPLNVYLGKHGPLIANINRYTVSFNFLEEEEQMEDVLTGMIFSMYARQIRRLTILPGAVPVEVQHLLSILVMTRDTVRRLGGVAHLLWQRGVGHITVYELTLPPDEVSFVDDEMLSAILGRAPLFLENREELLAALKGEPPQIARFLEETFGVLLKSMTDDGQQQKLEAMFQGMRTLDRIIVDELPEDGARIYDSLARAVLMLQEPLGPPLRGLIVRKAGRDPLALALLQHLAEDDLRRVVFDAFAHPGDSQEVAEAVAVSLGWAPALARQIIESAQRVLAPRGVVIDLAALPLDGVQGLPLDSELGAVLAGRPEEVGPPSADLVAEARRALVGLDERMARVEAIETAFDLLQHLDDRARFESLVDLLVAGLSLAVAEGNYRVLLRMMHSLRTLADNLPEERGEIARSAIGRLLTRDLIRSLVEWLNAGEAGRDRGISEVYRFFEEYKDDVLGHLLDQLTDEERIGIRRTICAVLVRIGENRVPALTSKLADPRWYVVRNIVGILGELSDPAVLRYLEETLEHQDARVRKETMRVLAQRDSPEAIAILTKLLQKPDEETRRQAARWLGVSGNDLAVPVLVQILERWDPLLRDYPLRRETIQALARLGSHAALPVLRRLAGRRSLFFRAKNHELRTLAQQAVAAVERRVGA
ncbi:MAG: HEAT repeat domain-containing protein [Armatimonadetes bacterium]|nr:HEAT repeat domain-containing protein [Armatimonadota bacterium]